MRFPWRLCGRATAGISALALLLSIAPSMAQAAPVRYRQLDGAGLIGVLPSSAEVPAWLGQPIEATRGSSVPTEGLSICYVGDERSRVPSEQNTVFQKEIVGPTPSLGASSFVNFGANPAGGYSNLITYVAQFPSAAAADAAWKEVLAQSRKCVASWTMPYPGDGTWTKGVQKVRSTVSTGDSLYGSPSLVITSTSSGTQAGASAPTRTGGGISVWRHVGNVIYEVRYTKALQRDVRSAVSVGDRITVNAISALIGERYISVAAQ